MHSLEFTFYTLVLVAAVVRRISGAKRFLRIVLVFAILAIAPLISESLLGDTHITMAILQKCLGTFS